MTLFIPGNYCIYPYNSLNPPASAFLAACREVLQFRPWFRSSFVLMVPPIDGPSQIDKITNSPCWSEMLHPAERLFPWNIRAKPVDDVAGQQIVFTGGLLRYDVCLLPSQPSTQVNPKSADSVGRQSLPPRLSWTGGRQFEKSVITKS